MPLLDLGPEPRDVWEYEKARELADALNGNNKLMTNPNMEKWSKEFEQLRTSHGIRVVEEVLCWYSNHIGKPHVPKAYSASSFHKHFNKLHQMSGVSITDDARKIHDELGLKWTKQENADQCLACIQLSLDNFDRFYRACLEYQHPHGTGACPVRNFARYLTAMRPLRTVYVHHWMIEVHRKTWSSTHVLDLSKWAIATTNIAFQRYLEKAAVSYCADPMRSKQLLDKLEVQNEGPDQSAGE